MKWQGPSIEYDMLAEDDDKIWESDPTIAAVARNNQEIVIQAQQALDTCDETQSSIEASAAMIEDTSALLKRLRSLS